jgi:feruloyl esterase
MGIWRMRARAGSRARALLLAGTIAVIPASAGLSAGPAGAALAAPATLRTASAASIAPAEPCSALTGLPLPNLPGPDTAAVSASEVAGSGCQVSIEITDTSDPRGGQPGLIGIDVTLPDSWNGNYMAEGGGVYCSPASFVTLAADQWLAAGYAISQDDCGHTGFTNALISPWVTNPSPPPSLNWNRIDDFGFLAHHLMAVESKAVIDAYYGAGTHYSFWNGCSTGGRQGLSEAQRYPKDFNGVLAGAPALNWDQFMVAQMWPQLVMEWNNDFLPTCKEDLVNTALQTHCRDASGQVDGVFDPRDCDVLGVLDRLVGTTTPCGPFTATDALVIREIWQGPRRSGTQRDLLHGLPAWFGMEPGASLEGAEAGGVAVTFPPGIPGFPAGTTGIGLAATAQQAGGQWAGAPFVPSADWFEKWIKQDPNWVFTDETYQQYWQDFLNSGRMFDAEIAADNPNLSAFKAAGGKLIMWQGLADQLIFTGDSINYYNRAVLANGGLRRTQSFFRYFLAPGVAHCGTPGPDSIAPTNPMQQVISWVENGQAPAVLDASGSVSGQDVTRPLCPYPDPDAIYTRGDPNAASSYTCLNRPQFTNPLQVGDGHRARTSPVERISVNAHTSRYST